MRLRVLGCSGGIGGDRRTTSLALDHDVLIDAGSGVGNLSLEEMSHIRHIFITHSHLDHIAFIPMLLDSIFDVISTPIIIHGQAVTLAALRAHIFNNVIWPDFSVLPTADNPVFRYEEMAVGDVVEIDGRRISMLPVIHSVPAVGYYVESDAGAFAFSGDTSVNDILWSALNERPRLDFIIVETAFEDKDEALGKLAKHYTPQVLARDLKKLQHHPKIYITHNKPGVESIIAEECRQHIQGYDLNFLSGGETIAL
ncbi:MAG: 3',5'-cyclic-nucleotide phosphodiesterase [Gammaproteobacteria bacterium]|nr:3',5'-cyclic-nucleotide phosphodiesterase [Gammaproteobacteria bacterium]